MPRSFYRSLRIKKWFPADDPFAICVARLCILWEDYTLELNGVIADAIAPLDSASELWRKVYFWRNFVRTLSEIQRVLDTLSSLKEFKAEVRKQPKKWQREFKDMITKFQKSRPHIKYVRDHVGGHVLEQGVSKALADMDENEFGIIQIGETMNTTHCKFAMELVSEILYAGAPKAERNARLESQFASIRGLVPVYKILYHIVFMYCDSRQLM